MWHAVLITKKTLCGNLFIDQHGALGQAGLERLDRWVGDGGTGRLGEGECDGQSVGGVRCGEFAEGKAGLHHFRNGFLLCGTEPDDCLFDFAGCDFEYHQPCLGHGGDGGATGLSHDEGGLDVLCVEQAFNGNHGWGGFSDDGFECVCDFEKAAGDAPIRRALDGALRKSDRCGGCGVDDSVTGAAERRVDPEYDLWPGKVFRFGRGDGFTLAKALLHGGELLLGKAHAGAIKNPGPNVEAGVPEMCVADQLP